MDLFELSRTILLVSDHPISKVRLARVIYFVHKELVRKKLMTPADILYLRSPLGPMPEGFLDIDEDDAIIDNDNSAAKLSYSTKNYTARLREDENDPESTLLEQYRDTLRHIEKKLKILDTYSTPQLIERSQKEPSWLAHKNGELYEISGDDLKLHPIEATVNTIRVHIHLSPRTEKNKSGAIQASLLRGMISDIVRESTDLEYPTDTEQKPNKKSEDQHGRK